MLSPTFACLRVPVCASHLMDDCRVAWGSSRDNAVRGGVGVGETHSLLIPGRGGGSVLKG